MASALWVVSAIANAAYAVTFERSSSPTFLGLLTISVCSLVAGWAAWFLPWERWTRRTLLWMIVPALPLIGLANAVNPDPYLVSFYFVMVAMWIGYTQPRWTTAALSPLILLAYWAPIAAVPHHPGLDASVIHFALVCVTVGETLGWASERLQRAQQTVADNAARFEALVSESADAMLVVIPSGHISYVSPSIMSILGIRAEALKGQHVTSFVGDYLHPDDATTAASTMREQFAETASQRQSFEVRLRGADGGWRDVECVAKPLPEGAALEGVLVNLRDVSERNSLRHELTYEALHDELTGLPNRSLLSGRLAHARARFRPLSLVLCDMDDFSVLNERIGHGPSDEVLATVAARLQQAAHPGDTVARIGSDEFVLVTEGDAETGRGLAITARDVIATPMTVGQERVTPSASLAVADAGPGKSSELLSDAGLAMREAKAAGAGSIRAYRPFMRTAFHERVDLQAELLGVAERGELRAYYQPVVELATGRTCAVEALVRWQHPERGLLSPSAFIHTAEEFGFIIPIGLWMLQRSLEDLAELQSTHPGLGLSVNLSAVQLSSDRVVDDIANVLAESGLPPELLTLEVTESTLLDDSKLTIERLFRLIELGLTLAVDDFGAGYSSLRYLRERAFGELKVDKSFIDSAESREPSRELLRSMARLGETLAVPTIAEGVEHTAQAQTLREMRFTKAQGYLYAKPMPFDELVAYLDGPGGRSARRG